MDRLLTFSLTTAPALMLTTLLVAASMHAGATEQARERQDARSTRQDSRQTAAVEKVDCRLEKNKTNAACRQDKRETKQEGREDARDARRGK